MIDADAETDKFVEALRASLSKKGLSKGSSCVKAHQRVKKLEAERDADECDEDDDDEGGKKKCPSCKRKKGCCKLESQCSNEAKMIQHLQETRAQMQGIAKALKQ